jgi:hypothetical protein
MDARIISYILKGENVMIEIEGILVDATHIWAITPIDKNDDGLYQFDVMVNVGTVKVKRDSLEEAEKERERLADVKASLEKTGEMLLG